MDAVLERLLQILKETMPDKEVGDVTRGSRLLADLGLDSLSLMMMALVVEDAFQIRFPVGFNPATVGDLCEAIEKAQGGE